MKLKMITLLTMKIKWKFYLSGAILILLLLPLVACSTQSSPQDNDLENTTWQLQSYGETGIIRTVLNGTEITAKFNSIEGRVYGSTGANSYSGSYEVISNKLNILELAWTEMYRLDPPGVMEQEEEYLKLFNAAESFHVKEGKLQINAGKQLLIYIEKALGILQGNVNIGPITPVERPGEKPTIPPEVYEARKIVVYDKNRDKLIAQVDIDSKGYYEVELKPGIYNVDINRIGMDRSSDVPKEIEIIAGKTIVLDIDIDTGIR
jgi:heat shock protein HslJ